jgi:hypothetical protein
MGFWLDLWFYWMQISDLIRLRFALSRLQNFGAFSLLADRPMWFHICNVFAFHDISLL